MMSSRWIPMALTLLGCGVQASPGAVSTCWLGRPGNISQVWRFGSNLSPAGADLSTNTAASSTATVAPGMFSSGWQLQLSGFGAPTGYWDLGRTGSVTLSCATVLAATNAPIYVAVEVTQWQDGGIYSELAGVTVSNATFLGREQRDGDQGTLGGWVIDRSLWRITRGSAGDLISIVGAFNGSIVDQVMIESAVPDTAWPGNMTLAADPGTCSKTNVTWAMPEVNGCFITAAICSPPSGSTFPVGSTAVACVATDVYLAPVAHAFTVVVQDVEPAPVSIAALPGGQVEISWPLGCAESTLVSKPALSDVLPWLPVAAPVQISGGRRFVVIDATGAMQFFRVRKP